MANLTTAFSNQKRLRHPGKAFIQDKPIKRKPEWIRVKAPVSRQYEKTRRLMRNLNLHTVCEEASCPNIGECWTQGHATVMILGSTCTRACSFCNVATGKPTPIDPFEPEHVALAVKELNLAHVVVTSVNRDDLADGGAAHFSEVILEIRKHSPTTTIEILTPDFLRKPKALSLLIAAKPDVYNHNLETVPRLYSSVRPGAQYRHSLDLLGMVKKVDPSIFTKSGIMVGFGELQSEVINVMRDLRTVDVDFITIGQYLQPTPKHISVERFVSPSEFDEYADLARNFGFLMVASSPLTRSSYLAGDDFNKLKNNRDLQLAKF